MSNSKVDIYTLTGFFRQNHTQKERVFFGGFFNAQREDDLKKDEPLFFSGFLIDFYGKSEIRGILKFPNIRIFNGEFYIYKTPFNVRFLWSFSIF